MDKYEFGISGNILYKFIWDDFCSWYIEMSKIILHSDDLNKVNTTKDVLYYVLNSIIILIHPLMPFVSEEIYQALHNDDTSIMNASWPSIIESDFSFEDEVMDSVIGIITSVRTLRNEENIANSKKIDLYIQVENVKLLQALKDNQVYIDKFASTNEVVISTNRNLVVKEERSY